jgi:hypothetical protein
VQTGSSFRRDIRLGGNLASLVLRTALSQAPNPPPQNSATRLLEVKSKNDSTIL